MAAFGHYDGDGHVLAAELLVLLPSPRDRPPIRVGSLVVSGGDDRTAANGHVLETIARWDVDRFSPASPTTG